jgi:hypothetical protein
MIDPMTPLRSVIERSLISRGDSIWLAFML